MDAFTAGTSTAQRSWASDSDPPASSPAQPAMSSIGLFDALRLLRSGSGALIAQAQLHAQLARVEWAVEKRRLTQLLVAAALGFASLLCLMLFVGSIGVAISWDTAYRIPTAAGAAAMYGCIAWLCWRRLRAVAARGADAFADTRTELAADIALLRTRL